MKYFDLISLLFAVLVVPVIPAFLVYKALPSRTTVQGPFKGLNIRLTGAFAGYFLLVLIAGGISIDYYKGLQKTISQGPKLEIWKVEGTMETEGLQGAIERGAFSGALIPTFFSATHVERNKVDFNAEVPIGRHFSMVGKKLNCPFRTLHIEYAPEKSQYYPIPVYLKEEEAKRHAQKIEYDIDERKIYVELVGSLEERK